MVYQITYYIGANRDRLTESDTISDNAMDRGYPVPVWPEWAEARHSDGTVIFGHHGEWREYLPTEVADYDRKEAHETFVGTVNQALAKLPRVSVSANRNEVTVYIGSGLSVTRVPWADLDDAATQDDPVGRRYYSAIRAAAKRALGLSGPGHLPVTVHPLV